MRQHSGKKRLGAVLLSLALCLSLLPTAALAADNVDYIYYTGTSSLEKHTGTATATVVTANDTTWGTSGDTSWYVVQGEVTIDNRVTVSGHACLILADGCKLTVNGASTLPRTTASPSMGRPRAPVHSLPRTAPPAVQGSAAVARAMAVRSLSTAAM